MADSCSDPYLPDCAIGYLARRIHQLGQAGMEPVFAAHALTGIQWSALMAISAGRARNSAELAREISYDKGATTRLVDVLDREGWVTRCRDPQDRRVVNLALTPAGEAVAHDVRVQVTALWDGWLRTFSPQDVETLTLMMQRLRTSLETAVFGAGA